MPKNVRMGQEDKDMNCMTKRFVLFENSTQIHRSVIRMFSGIEVAHFWDRTSGPTIIFACEVMVWLMNLPRKRRRQKLDQGKK